MNDIEGYKFLKQLTKLPFVDEIWLFGSRIRGYNSERSDIDLAIGTVNNTFVNSA